MNILFVNYGDFTTNSLNHIGGFANWMCSAGHTCIVAVPKGKDTLQVVLDPLFIPATFDELLAEPGLFPNGKGADVVHAWTPREVVRKFVLAYQAHVHARLIVHLEDNEEVLLAAWMGKDVSELAGLSEADLENGSFESFSHPRRFRNFLQAADGITVIVDSLKKFVPTGTPSLLLRPGIDFGHVAQGVETSAERPDFGLEPGERVIAFTGSNTFVNESELRELYVAVQLLNQRGFPTRLVRTGFGSPQFQSGLSDSLKSHIIELGFVAKKTLPGILSAADVLVQPGKPGPFNDFRLPSKLPEFLASGRPVILPNSNIGTELRDEIDALLLRTGAPEEIAKLCARVFEDSELARRLGKSGRAYAKQHFDLGINSQKLAAFYAEILSRQVQPGSTSTIEGAETEISLALRRIASRATDPEAAALIEQLRPLVVELERRDAARDETLRKGPWRRIYPAAALARIEEELALTHRHAFNLDKILADTQEQLKETHQHASNLEKNLAGAQDLLREARQHAGNLESNLAGAQIELKEARQRIVDLEEALTTALSDLKSLRADYETVVAKESAARTEITIRQDKVRQIQASFSWRVTQPLRALRRTFLDRKPPRPLSDRIIACVDHPRNWGIVQSILLLRGWAVHRDGGRLTAIRARLGKRVFGGEIGIERLDVADHFPNDPTAANCGWIVRIEVPRFMAHLLVLEAKLEDGSWHAFFRQKVARTSQTAIESPDEYTAWIQNYDTLTPEAEKRIQGRLEGLNQFPLISVLMPVYNAPERWLIRAIESVRKQLYKNWELCIADDASTSRSTKKILARYARKDKRIKVVYREKNGHISAASNSALEIARGEFVALLDHDDEIRPHALAAVALELNGHPQADIIYSDEDKIDENGSRFEPYFKPDWNPDLFLAQNYLSHLGVYRITLVREVGGFRTGFEGSQDWDLAMRVSERTVPDRIRHIPKILYHWRTVQGSTAIHVGAKNYAVEAAKQVIEGHFVRMGIDATISPTSGHYWRVIRPIPNPAPKVTLIIPTRNRLNVLRPCIESILQHTTYPFFEILVIDNDSDEPETLAYLANLRKTERCRVLKFPGEFNFSAINNFAVDHTDAPIVGLLNNDLEVSQGDWLNEMVANVVRPEIGCVGAKLYHPNGLIQHAGVVLGVGGVAAHAWQSCPANTSGPAHRVLLQQNYSAVTAACLLVRREVYLQAGGFDAEHLAVAFNDIDFCLKVRAAGYRNFWTPVAELIHHESVSRGSEDTDEKRERFRKEVEFMMKKWGGALLTDAAYNPNLTLQKSDFSLASPPRTWPPID